MGDVAKEETSEVTKFINFEEDGEKRWKNWRKQLTGGLDNTEVLISLFILICFYICYAFINFWLDNNRDEYTITSGCPDRCRSNARTPYRWSFGVLVLLWIIFHTYIFIVANLRYLEFSACCCVNACMRLQNCVQNCGICFIIFSRFISRLIWACITYCPRKRCGCLDDDSSSNVDELTKDKHREKLYFEHYEKILWYRYYRLYVIGYSKDIKPDKTYLKSDCVDKDDKDKSNSASPPTQSEGSRSDDYYCWKTCQSCIDNNNEASCNCYHLIIREPVLAALVVLKYIAQGATVPLLMLQVFDTYALLCFSKDDKYCETVSEYQIHLAQVAITIGFYFSIALAQLSNAVLEWDQNKQAVKKT